MLGLKVQPERLTSSSFYDWYRFLTNFSKLSPTEIEPHTDKQVNLSFYNLVNWPIALLTHPFSGLFSIRSTLTVGFIKAAITINPAIGSGSLLLSNSISSTFTRKGIRPAIAFAVCSFSV